MNSHPLARMMEKGVRDGVFPGAVLLCARPGDVLFHGGFGVTNLKTGVPVQGDAVFDLASLTKPLATALSVAVLIQDGALDLKTTLGQVLSDTRGTQKESLTLDMLLRHTSGLPAHRNFYEADLGKDRPRRVLRSLLIDEPLENKPDTIQVYSDLGYMFLSWVIETVSGKRLDVFVKNNVYIPLGIRCLFFRDLILKKKLSPSLTGKMMATQSCPWRGKTLVGEVEDENAWVAGGIEGHAGLFGDAPSVAALCEKILLALKGRGNGLLDPGLLKAFLQVRPGQDMVAGFDTPAKENSSAGSRFGSGAFGHLGYTGTSFWVCPETELIVVLLTNRVHPVRTNLKIREFRPKIHDAAMDFFC
ncbi:MAG: beta-lactamase family protein [Desulfovibrionales bacterium]|nr:beta-lactamase family protein [Desulfovibrionales bacterium]